MNFVSNQRPFSQIRLGKNRRSGFGAHLAHFSTFLKLMFVKYGLGWRSGQGTALPVGQSRDRFPVVSLEIFSVATDRTI